MATVASQRTDALAELQILAQTDAAPALDTEVEEVLDRFQRAGEWSAGTLYNFGDLVVPTTLNGRVYRCTRAGMSGASEPTWPVDSLTAWCASPAWASTADNTAEWQDAGALTEVFDVRAAAVRCVQMKLGKVGASSLAAAANSWSADGVTITRNGDSGENLRAPLLALLKSLQPAGIA